MLFSTMRQSLFRSEFLKRFRFADLHRCNRRSSFSSSSSSNSGVRHFAHRNKRSSSEVRASFIDYFVSKHDHRFVRSSSVRPDTLRDGSLLFVNAGMNQFKPIFLGSFSDEADEGEARQNDFLGELKRAVNSQKCIRVGGKHCDLEAVGTDFTHHTFFEMLGNWSFDDYGKKEACSMAWTLLTQVYHIDPSRLFVTIFGGDESLRLPADLESYEIWRSIGLPAERIIPLGVRENFWEMGNTGPCGICTEIHYEVHHHADRSAKSPDYTAQLLNNSFEIWNIVFIQFFRDAAGSLKRLEKNFVDTGMGLERILSLVQGVPNNYATDLFTPYFAAISKLCKWPEYSHRLSDPKDVAYRILADHCRMACVAIADEVKPDDRGAGYLLRRVLRRAIDASRSVAQSHGSMPAGVNDSRLLTSLAEIAIDSLGDAYPELRRNSSQIISTIDEEVRLYESAITRNVQLMKLADQLQIELSENADRNQAMICEKLRDVEARLAHLAAELDSPDARINPADLDAIRRELSQLSQLSSTDLSLATRFGLSSGTIDETMSRVQLELLDIESILEVALRRIITQFESAAKQHMSHFSTHRSLSIRATDCVTNYRPSDFFLLKIAADMFADRHPLAVLLRPREIAQQDSILVQLNVPPEQAPQLDAATWFDRAIERARLAESVQVFPIKNKRPKRVVRFRVKANSAAAAADTEIDEIIRFAPLDIETIGEQLRSHLNDIAQQYFIATIRDESQRDDCV